jgi:hypothetical protein
MRDSPIVCTYLRPEAFTEVIAISTAAKRYIQTKFNY